MQSPAPEEEQLQEPIYAEDHPAGKKLGRKGSGRQRDEHESAMCPWGKKPLMVSWAALDKVLPAGKAK